MLAPLCQPLPVSLFQCRELSPVARSNTVADCRGNGDFRSRHNSAQDAQEPSIHAGDADHGRLDDELAEQHTFEMPSRCMRISVCRIATEKHDRPALQDVYFPIADRELYILRHSV